MRCTVLHILSTSYSGSSLLTLLLDSQPGVRGLGEAVHLARQSHPADCTRCRVPASRCAPARAISSAAFYGSIFDFYGDANVLVDSSKSLTNSLLLHAPEPQVRHRFVLLSKSPHEFAASFAGHHPAASVSDAFQAYVDFYDAQLQLLWSDCGVTASSVAIITYRELTMQPDVVVQSLGRLVGVETGPLAERRWWETDSHLIGGNWLVTAQVTGFDEAVSRAPPGDQARYRGRHGAVFYDDAWTTNRALQEQCAGAYQRWEPRLTPLLEELRQPPVSRLRKEVLNPAPPKFV